MMWFTADLHLGHRSIIDFCKRPFRSVGEMDNILIRNWNTVVKEGDLIYVLGDLTLRGFSDTTTYCRKLNGEIHIVPGSHDKKWLRHMEKDDVPLYSKEGIVTILPPLHTTYITNYRHDKKLVIVLCHYALRVWDKSHFNSWQLYGHSHGRLRPIGKQYDIGTDHNGFFPIHLDELYKIMKRKPDNLNYVGRR